MSETVRNIADRDGDERATARAITELLTRVGALEGRVISTQNELNSTRLVLEEYRSELERTLRSVRAMTGRAQAAAERVRAAQQQLSEQVYVVRNSLLDSGRGA